MQRFLRNLSLRTDGRRTTDGRTTDACAITVALLTKSSRAKNSQNCLSEFLSSWWGFQKMYWTKMSAIALNCDMRSRPLFSILGRSVFSGIHPWLQERKPYTVTLWLWPLPCKTPMYHVPTIIAIKGARLVTKLNRLFSTHLYHSNFTHVHIYIHVCTR